MEKCAFAEWSPLQLAARLGYRIDLVSTGGGQRSPMIVGPNGRRRYTSHGHACTSMARLAAYRGIDPANPPSAYPRALINGKEQDNGSC